MAQQNWGSVPDWFAAVGTVGAVAYALHTGRRDQKRWERERKEAEDRFRHEQQQAADRLRREQEQSAEDRAVFRQQAEIAKRRLAGRVTVIAQKVHSSKPHRDGFEGPAVKWEVHNAGDEPISMVVVAQRTIPSGPEAVAVEIAESWPVIEAGGSRETLTQLHGENFHPNREVQFTDGAGIRWQRKSFGELRELPDEDPETIRLVMMQI